jgi:long-chain fatty acid transport protein
MKSHLNPITGQRAGWIFASTLVLGVAVPEKSYAIGFLLPNQDATAIARGNAFDATADNPSAIYYNPAGISQLPGINLELGELNYLGINTTYESTSGSHVDSKFQVIPVPEIYGTYSPTNLPVSFGLGVYAPFGLGVQWPGDSSLRSLAIDSKLTYITINPVVSWQVIKSLSVAVGPTINYADISFSRGLLSPNDFYQFSGTGFSYGLTAGLLWKPLSELSFGANYRLASTTDFHGTSTYGPAPGDGTESVGTSASVPFPQTVSTGISYRPTPKWNLEVDVDYINWSTLGTVTLNGTRNIFGADLPLVLNWHDSWQYKFGVTRYLDDGWFISAGYFYSTDTTSSSSYLAGVPDTNLHVGSLGFGRDGEHWRWAVAGQIIAGPSRTIGEDAGNTDPYTGVSAAGKYRLFVPTLSVSVGYRF